MGDDDRFVVGLHVTPEAHRELDAEIDRGSTFAGHSFHLDDDEVYIPFWNREHRYIPREPPFWDINLLEDAITVARQLKEHFSLQATPTFNVMLTETVIPEYRFALGAAYPRRAGGGGLALPILRDHGLSIERLPPLKYEGNYNVVDYAYKLIGRVQDFLLYEGLRDQKDQLVLFRVVRNGTPFSRFQYMAKSLEICLGALARATNGTYDPAKAWGVFWPETEFDNYFPPFLSDSTLT